MNFDQVVLINYLKPPSDVDEFENRVSAFILMTYWDGFVFNGIKQSDSGWGCMIRVGQMAIANALLKIYKNWETVINLFLDYYFGKEAPFSIINLIHVGYELVNKAIGEWYGAHSITQVLHNVNEWFNKTLKLKTVVFNDGIVYWEILNETIEENENLFIMIPIRIGAEKVAKIHVEQLKQILFCSLCQGILGGKQYFAQFIIGYNETHFISLDPHTTQ